MPNFSGTLFAEGSPFARNLAKELIIILINFGLDVNYHNKNGFTPLIEAIRNKLRSLQNFLLSGYNQKLDVNMRSKNTSKMMSTALHIAVENNDTDAAR
jgi:ankyrin repeat protein